MPAEAAPIAPAAPVTPIEGSGPPAGAQGGDAAAPAEPSHVQDAAKKAGYAERKAKALAVFNGAQKGALALVGPGTAPPAEETPPPADEPAEETPPPAAAKPEPALSAKEETAHARALTALRKTEAEKLELKRQVEKAESDRKAERDADRAETAKLKAQLEAISKDPSLALKHAGMTPDQYMRGVVEGKIKPPAAEDALREHVEGKLSPLEQRLAETEAKLKAREDAEAEATKQAEQTAAHARNLETVKRVLPAEEYPLIAALGAHETVLGVCYKTGSEDVAAKAAEFEAHQVSLLENLLTPKVLAALEKRSPKIRETVSSLRAANQSRQPAVSSGGPRVAARDVVSAPTTPVERPKTPAERMSRAKAVLKGELP